MSRGSEGYLLGIDLGGTKIEVAALDGQGEMVLRRRRDTPQGQYQQTVQAIVELVEEAERELGAKGTVGVAIPGAISQRTGWVKNANSTCLNGQPLQHDLEVALRRPVRLANDANCFALSEAIDGAASGAESVFGVIIGTGTGGGVVVQQRILSGVNRIAGEWGHNPLPWMEAGEYPGPACWCGRLGCMETFLSGPALSAEYVRITSDQQQVQEIVLRAERGELEALQLLDRFYLHLAKGLSQVINILDPEVVVLGGGLSNIAQIYKQVPLLWGDYIFSDEVRTRLVAAKYGDSSGVRGAAWLWKDQALSA